VGFEGSGIEWEEGTEGVYFCRAGGEEFTAVNVDFDFKVTAPCAVVCSGQRDIE